jgi:integrase
MFNSSHIFTPEPIGGLYEVVANEDGVRLSAHCPEGHEMVVELMQRLGLFNQSPALRRWKPPTDHADTSHITFTWPAPSPAASANHPAPVTASAVETHGVRVHEPAADTQADHRAGDGASLTAVPSDAPPLSMRLSELTDLHLGNMKRGKNGERSSTKERKYILTLLREVIGDKPVAAITTEDAAAFADVLSVWPAYVHNQPDFKHMSALNIAAKAKLEKCRPIHSGTQGKHVKAIKAFFHWCIESQAIKEDPFRFIQLSRYRDVIPRKKDVFSTPDLQTLFNADRMRSFTEPHKFWVPLIALHTGMRVNEISQLYVEDVKADTVLDETGAPHRLLYFDVSPFREGQSVKSPHAKRSIPVHSRLIGLGFEAYVDDVRRSGAVHLFPGLTWKADGPGRVVTQWFNGRHLRKLCGITTPSKTLHCFRHTITTLADRSFIPDSVMRTINGHSDGVAIDKRSYVARGSLLECKRALEKLPFPDLDLVPYTPDRFAPYLDQVRETGAHRARLQAEGKPISARKGRPPKLRQLVRPAP